MNPGKQGRRHVFIWLIACWAMMNLPLPSRADFAAYLNKPEPVYKWEKRSETKIDGGMVYDLHLVSQTWQGIVWEHRLQIFRPDKLTHPHFCALLNTGGNGGPADALLGITAAKGMECEFAILYNIPNQPLYGGKTEDALIVYTWQKFLETGDETWPLHFPMAKAVIKAMDAIQAFTKEAGQPDITEFMITGASKRGWTTWLTAASGDKRVKAIAPMVIDTLNLAAQIPHQLEAYGKASEQIGDYTNGGLLDIAKTERGRRLIELEDPYSYRDKLTLPKLLILGTNDRYWAQDALNLYWDGLKGPKWVLYTPNSGHGLEDRIRVLNTLNAFAVSVASKTKWPQPKWEYHEGNGGVNLSVRSDVAPDSARLFRVFAPTQDFRDAKWTSEPMEAVKNGFTGHLDSPATGYAATFGEVTYTLNGKTFTLSTQIRILPAQKVTLSAPSSGRLFGVGLKSGICRPDTLVFQEEKREDTGRPAVNPGRPTITDPGSLTAPGWLEAEFGGFKNLDRDRTFGTPLLLKLTSLNRRLQYRLGFDGYVQPGSGPDGLGELFPSLQYLFAPQDRAGYDISGRLTVKIPTAPAFLGTRKVDYGLLLLASRDYSPQVHADFNLGLSSLSRQAAPGTDTQFLATASFTLPIKGGRWAYTNELVYASPIAGTPSQVTTMHGFTYAVHRYDVYDIALQWQLHGSGAHLQLLFGKSFFFGKLF